MWNEVYAKDAKEWRKTVEISNVFQLVCGEKRSKAARWRLLQTAGNASIEVLFWPHCLVLS